MAALPLTNLISQSSTRKRRYRTLSAQFGDGYSQEAPNGINNALDEWTVVYENLTTTERNTLVAALDAAQSSDLLAWQPPGDSTTKQFKITLDGWTETAKSGSYWDISFTLRQIV